MVTRDVHPLPDGTRLLHIGPHKTGTTTLQAAFHASREALAHEGVHYAGARAHSMRAAMAATTDDPLPTQDGAAVDLWQELCDEVRSARARSVVVSSEFYSDATDERAAALVEDLDPDRTHVVVTLRALHRILPSQWQQYMQNRMVVSYDDWLDEMLHHAGTTRMTPTFWQRHRHDLLVRRWVEVVGRDRLTVVVVDERNRSMLTSTFESLVGVPPGTLRSAETANRSLSFTEVELLRAFNRQWRDHGWSEADYTRLVRFGAARHLQLRTPGPEEERLLTPRWAVDRALEVQREMAADIAATGVRVVGDLDSLVDPGLVKDVGTNSPVTEVPADVAARLAAGLVRSVATTPRREPTGPGRVVGELEAAARRRPPGLPARPAGHGPGQGGPPRGLPARRPGLLRLVRRLLGRQ